MMEDMYVPADRWPQASLRLQQRCVTVPRWSRRLLTGRSMVCYPV